MQNNHLPLIQWEAGKMFFTQQNNVMGNVNLLFATKYVPNAHFHCVRDYGRVCNA